MFQKEDAQTETVVGQSVKLKGNLKSQGDIRIAGSLSGEIKTKGNVVISQEAVIRGKVSGQNVNIAGSISGDVEAKEQLEITESGKVFGDIKTNILIIKAGGIFTGRSEMQMETLEEKPVEVEPEPEIEEVASEEEK